MSTSPDKSLATGLMRTIYVHTHALLIRLFIPFLVVWSVVVLPNRAASRGTWVVTNLVTRVNFVSHGAMHGGMAEFDSATEEWQAYEERLSQYLISTSLVSYPDPHRSCGWITSPLLA